MIKTRFSPSPTGLLHIGNIRTALYNWLFAKNKNGKFILRIEDTDLKRFNKKYVKNIIDTMNWLKITWDKGPYFQSTRYKKYCEVIKKLLNEKKAYKCYCSQERLNELRNYQIKYNKKPKYDELCRNNNNILHKPYVIRFKNKKYGITSFHDSIRGTIKFNNKELDDLILFRSDGTPTYNFCVSVDDWDMKITHVIRGEDHINNTPKQINILKAIGAIKIPIYSHLSMIFDENKKKLSKRSNSIIDILKFKEAGYLRESILNHILRLGWSYGNKEIFSIEEMQKYFHLGKFNKSKSIFNMSKLQSLNQYYINSYNTKDLTKKLSIFIKQEKINLKKGPEISKIVNLFKTRCKTLKEIITFSKNFYHDIENIQNNEIKNHLNYSSYLLLKIIYKKLEKIKIWSLDNIKNIIYDVKNQFNIRMKDICIPLRIAITGSLHSPSIYEVIYISEKIYVLKRIIKFLEYIKKNINIIKK